MTGTKQVSVDGSIPFNVPADTVEEAKDVAVQAAAERGQDISREAVEVLD